MWPNLTVRSWVGVLARRDPDWRSSDDDDPEEALEARRIHELRGLVMAQVAEIEDLLRFVLVEAGSRTNRTSRSLRLHRPTAGAALKRVESLLEEIGLAERFRHHITQMESTIHRRNKLVHATVKVGFSQMGEYGPHVPVIVLLMTRDEQWPEQLASSRSAHDDEQTKHQDTDAIDESDLEDDLRKAYEALEAAIDIWEAVDRELPVESRS
jgi:hypothetical protein